MSQLKASIMEAVKTALKAGEKDKLGVIRLIQAAIKQKEVDERIDLNDEQVLGILDKMIRQRRDSVQQFQAGNRPDLVEKENFQILVIQSFMPAQLSETEIQALVKRVILEVQAQSIRDMARVMQVLKPQVQGRADMGYVGQLLKDKLSG